MKTKRFRTTKKSKPATALARKYETKLDAKKRVVLRGAQHKYYEVNEKANGSILLTPKKLVDIEPMSARSLAMFDSSVVNFKKGIVSEPIDLNALRKKYGLREGNRVLASNRLQKLPRHTIKAK
jgi:hypothetical protein